MDEPLIFYLLQQWADHHSPIMPYDKIMELLWHKTFFRDMRKYNSAMAFASMRCNLDHTLANAK
jgi:hypothetical protein